MRRAVGKKHGSEQGARVGTNDGRTGLEEA